MDLSTKKKNAHRADNAHTAGNAIDDIEDFSLVDSRYVLDQVILLPWKHVAYMVDDDKERPHVVRITTFDDVASREERVVQLSLQFKEECLVWLKCIQVGNQFLLQSEHFASYF